MDESAAARLAAEMGLPELRAGGLTLRNARRWREGVISVVDLWCAAIHPSFDQDAILCYAATEETQFRGKRFGAWQRAGILLHREDREPLISWAPIDGNPLRDSVAAVDVMTRSGSHYLDGIGYEVILPSGDAQAYIRFANPVLRDLCAIESALYETARRVAAAAKEAEIVAFTKAWVGYLEDRTRR